MPETGSSRKSGWWREVLIGFVVAFAMSAYYSAKATRAERRAEQAEARLKQMEQEQQGLSVPPGNQVNDVPKNLVCPEGTSLSPFVDFASLGNPLATKSWQCVGKPKPVGTPPPPPGNNPRKVNP